MLTFAVIAGSLWLISLFALASYGVHLGISNQIELKAQKLSTHKIQFVPLDSDAALEEAALNKTLNDIDDDQMNHLTQTVFKQGPIL